jgi:prepilin-type N-terminal cleavage/methylation domain-containing protein
MERPEDNTAGFTLVEITVAMLVLSVVAVSFLALFISLVRSTIIAKRQAVASTLATNQMEYLKSLPYDNLAVAGGSIYTANPIPATTFKTLNGVKYTVTTSINYVDDAYDGCASYPTPALKQLYCRNLPAPTGAPATDLNPADYKIAHVKVTDKNGGRLAEVDTEISSRVSETASATGALFVSVIDSNGNPVSGAAVSVTNSTITPAANVSDSTDSNGTAIFYGLPPDSGTDYVISASLAGYSSLATIASSGSLQPTYPSQKIISQQSSYVTLTLKPQGTNSLLLEAVDTSGTPINNLKVYIKGGYKKYTSITDTAYYYDNLTPSDVRPITDSGGLASVQGLVPGAYIFCGDTASSSCKVGNTTYYLVAAMPYGGTNAFNPVTVPTYVVTSPPATTYDYNGSAYLQKVRLVFSTQSTYPRVASLTPPDISLAAGGLGSYGFTITGNNLPCSSNAAACSTTVSVVQGANTFAASCKGAAAGVTLNCTANLSGLISGNSQLIVTANGFTFTPPASQPPLGGFVVTP